MYKVIGENTLTGNQWDCETDIPTMAEAFKIQVGYIKLESDYKISYRIQEM